MANAFVHCELNSTDPEKAKSFYGQLFEWKLQDMQMGPSGTYTMIDVGDGTGGGILKHPMGGPSIWIPYALVSSAAEATAKAKSLGATIIKDISEIPGMGRFSIIQDPSGGVIGLWESTQE